MSKRVAIIGAGACGLAAIKTCLEEGLEPVCLEKTDRIGGLWNYTNKSEEGVSCVMKSTITNTSKEMTGFSDFPIPADYPNFMHHSKFLDYLNLYIKHFSIDKYIRCLHMVVSITKADDFERNGEWIVEYKNLSNGDQVITVERFQAVMLCTGHFADGLIPDFPGANSFQGKRMHSIEYKHPVGYEGKRVVVIGLGNSGGDIAVELSRTAKQVYLSTRRGGWVLGRLHESGVPLDLIGQRRIVEIIRKSMGYSVMNKILRREINKRFDHRLYGLEPAHEPLSQHPMVNEDLPGRIICGAIQVRPNVQQVTQTGVIFEDGSEVDADVIIYATGYKYGFPFVKDDVIQCAENKLNLYKYVFPPDLDPSTMAVIGACAPWGSVLPIAEIQCRWVCRVFADLANLPTREQMWRDILANRTSMESQYTVSPRHTVEAEWIPYLDDIASRIGCKPSLLKLLFTDPPLLMKVLFGPCVPYQYRLMGPNTWSGARDVIMHLWQRVKQPLQTRPVPARAKRTARRNLLLLIIAAALYQYRDTIYNGFLQLKSNM